MQSPLYTIMTSFFSSSPPRETPQNTPLSTSPHAPFVGTGACCAGKWRDRCEGKRCGHPPSAFLGKGVSVRESFPLGTWASLGKTDARWRCYEVQSLGFSTGGGFLRDFFLLGSLGRVESAVILAELMNVLTSFFIS